MFFVLVLGYNILFYLGEYYFGLAENHLLTDAFLLLFLIFVTWCVKHTDALAWSFGRKYEKTLPLMAWVIPGLFGLWSMVQTTMALHCGAELNSVDVAIGTLLLVILAAVYEELLFRGFVFEYLLSVGVSCALWGSGILFAAAHMFNSQPKNFGYDFVIQVVIALCLGYSFSVYVFITKSLFPPICMHIWINAMSPFNYLKEASYVDGYDLWVYAVFAIACFVYSNRLRRQYEKVR